MKFRPKMDVPSKQRTWPPRMATASFSSFQVRCFEGTAILGLNFITKCKRWLCSHLWGLTAFQVSGILLGIFVEFYFLCNVHWGQYCFCTVARRAKRVSCLFCTANPVLVLFLYCCAKQKEFLFIFYCKPSFSIVFVLNMLRLKDKLAVNHCLLPSICNSARRRLHI